ncbi:Exopolysaccharide biosynthesis protein YbjH [Loktanella atrilutea]|uniref:Exopolysaccharide biosynthesis protein YbjH n=1 Tax=Loktanella atrilutea TaxID=366533 RepID=A0A1M5EJL7_LOKAT|nr:YjbH domain-containing protein [Loktanella atrilutea]SHF79334.1 Exopolysaccharide biosynthesis protein YbjH [Loktanella atrilutea]
MYRRVGYAAMLAMLAGGAAAQDNGPSYTSFGTPGLLEMPTAESADPNDIAVTLAYSPSAGYRTSFTYQLTDRLSGSFRYGVFDQYGRPTATNPDPGTFETFDRSFDIQYRLTNESGYLPAIAVGLRDFLGTGRYSSEYVVASKSVGSKLVMTAGLGWGRMGQKNGFGNPLGVVSDYFDDRPVYQDREFSDDPSVGLGGQLSVKQWFRGDAALFFGAEYQLTDKLGIKAEYSSISYPEDVYNPAVDYKSPINVGLSYRYKPGIELGASYMYGSEFGLRGTFILNPTERGTASGLDPAPAPVRVRTADQRAAATWDRAKQPEPAVRAGLAKLLAVEGIELVGLELTDRTARLRYQNTRYRSEAQAMGRAARMMTQIIPPSVQTFVMEPVQAGIPLSQVTLPRAQIEAQENMVGGTSAIYDAATFGQAGAATGLETLPDPDPRFRWGIAPYLAVTVFDGSGPINADVGLEATAEYQVSRNLILSGRVQQSFRGKRDPLGFFDNPNDYANVRSDQAYFGRSGDPILSKLTAAYYTRLTPDIYGRVTVGYLEKMYGGISTEVLWAPVASRLALGAEVNYVSMRDQDVNFDFAEYKTVVDPVTRERTRVKTGTFDAVTAHVSAYYDIGRGYQAQVDVGRYLAGDYGATFALDREYANGWKVGGYFSLTDMPFDQFGEGSFDKGIRITIPYDYFLGTPTQKTTSTVLQSLARDGGARVQVDGRLYETIRSGQLGDLTTTWGRFWR